MRMRMIIWQIISLSAVAIITGQESHPPKNERIYITSLESPKTLNYLAPEMLF